jgi:hypothetical protein
MNPPADTNLFLAWLPAIGGLLALVCLWAALRSARRRRLVDGLPTCKTTGVFIGLVEVKGTAEAEAPLTSYLTDTRCVHYTWSVEEKLSRLVTETTTDSKGNTRTTVRRESGWKTIAEGGEQTPFYLRDDCGVLLVRPDGAEVEATLVCSTECDRSDPLYYGKAPTTAIAHSDHERRFVESAIPLHEPVYVIGRARERADVVAAEIAADREAPLFLISTRAEKQISGGYAATFWSSLLAGLVLCSAGFGFGLPETKPLAANPVWLPFALGAGVYACATFVFWVWSVFNGLIELRNRVAAAWSEVDVQLKRRFDLIPRLEGVVQGLADHERSVQESVAALRAQREATPPGVTGPDFQGLGGRLVALVERHPELKANTAFLPLQRELADTESRIALARGYYNEIATHYNTKLEIIPERFVAALARLAPRPLLAAGDFERAPVQVTLAT